uniref:CUB domain-containing protein n=1 Tax=Ditylenchus dipsaci TaxID=166011 RepID=A0A915EN82_9BILA
MLISFFQKLCFILFAFNWFDLNCCSLAQRVRGFAQTHYAFDIYEGASEDVSENTLLGKFTVVDSAATVNAINNLNINLMVDRSGNLTVSAGKPGTHNIQANFLTCFYIQRYGENLNCNYTIVADPGHRVEIRFTYFSTEGISDYVRITEGGPSGSVIKTVSGAPLLDTLTSIKSAGRVLTLRFSTDGSITVYGWTAEYRFIADC